MHSSAQVLQSAKEEHQEAEEAPKELVLYLWNTENKTKLEDIEDDIRAWDVSPLQDVGDNFQAGRNLVVQAPSPAGHLSNAVVIKLAKTHLVREWGDAHVYPCIILSDDTTTPSLVSVYLPNGRST